MKIQTRKKFLLTGLSLAALGAFFGWRKQPKEKKTLRFLTQDGKLVEIDADRLPTSKRTATKTDVQNWVKKKL